MKKFGFTLAEVLITLGIIGVVAALATPALITSAGNAKIGPSLAKAVSTLTTAQEMMLTQEEVGSLYSITSENFDRGARNYWPILSSYMKVSPLPMENITYKQFSSDKAYSPTSLGGDSVSFGMGSQGYVSEEGFIYYIHLDTKMTPNEQYKNIPSNQLLADVFIDINGKAKPNKIGKDLFRFYLYNDGSVKPYGSQGFDKRKKSSELKELWNLNNNCDENGVRNADTCAGSIFENNFKVIYK